MPQIISQEELEKLNKQIGELLEIKEHTSINYDFLEQLYGNLLRSKDIITENPKRTIVPIKQTEMIEQVLNFFKSIDDELYEKAKAILEGRDENVEIIFANASDDRNWYDESNVKMQSGKSVINILTQQELPRGQRLEADMCTLEDLFGLVHEISHTFDIDYTKKQSQEKRSAINFTRRFYGESLPIAFETLLTEYLIEKTDYPINAIEQRYYRRTNDLYDMTSIQYAKLLLAKVQEQEGEITNENMQEFIQKNGLGLNYARYIVSRINDDPQSFMGRNRYPIAGLIGPKIVNAYKESGSIAIKEYLTAVKDDRQEDLLKTLGITMDEDGISKLVLGAIEQDRDIQDTTHQKDNEEKYVSIEENEETDFELSPEQAKEVSEQIKEFEQQAKDDNIREDREDEIDETIE